MDEATHASKSAVEREPREVEIPKDGARPLMGWVGTVPGVGKLVVDDVRLDPLRYNIGGMRAKVVDFDVVLSEDFKGAGDAMSAATDPATKPVSV